MQNKKNRIIIFFLLILFTIRTAISANNEFDDKIFSLEKKLGVKIIYNQIIPDRWKASKYNIPKNYILLDNYLKLLEQEYSKYPKGFFKKAKAGTIILTEKYSFNGNKQAAMPDPYGNRLYLAIDGAYGNKSEKYLIHVMHHELNHCTEYAIWKNQYYKWKEWSSLESPPFKYGRGGITAYKKKDTDYYSLVHPRKGFINLYSMTGQEEDRSELIAVMMSDMERPVLHKHCKKDHLLQAKVKKLVLLLNSFSGVSENSSYWEQKNRNCYSK